MSAGSIVVRSGAVTLCLRNGLSRLEMPTAQLNAKHNV